MTNPITNKTYQCEKCQTTTIQATNHYGATWSNGHFNCCPNCPPHAKYPEFNGRTIWRCLDLPPFKTFILDEIEYQYNEFTVFEIQVGKGPKGSYKPRYTITGNWSQAWMYYRGINIGHGYKKRLQMDKKLLAKQIS